MVNCYRTSRNLRHVAMILTDQIFVKESLRISTRNERNHHSIYLITCEFWRQLKPISLYLYRMTFTILHNKSNNKFHWQSFIIHKTWLNSSKYFDNLLNLIDGSYIVRNNDASILNHKLQANIKLIRNWAKKDDIVGRGFRDYLTGFEDHGV